MPEDLQEAFLREWWDDRREGVSTRSMHEMLKGHIEKDEEHQREVLQRVASIETNDKRDAEDRFAEKTGRFNVAPLGPWAALPPALKESKPPKKTTAWWSQEPFKTPIAVVLTAVSAIVATYLATHYGK